MATASAGWASLLRLCALGLFVVSAIIYWGAWTPTTAAGLLSAGLACLAASFLHVPEQTARPRTARRDRVHGDDVFDEPLTREADDVGTRRRTRV